MRPVLFEFFGLKIYGYGTMVAIGIVAATLLLEYRIEKEGYDENEILKMSIFPLIFAALGGKILYIITDMENIKDDPIQIIKNFGGGFVIYGALIGASLGIYISCKAKKWNTLKILDLFIPSIALAQGFGRIGCLLAGCCYGKPTELPIGIKFNNSFFAPNGVYLHPTQIYSSIFDFLLAFFLLYYDKKENKDGRVFSFYLIFYSIGRFFIEYFRGDLERGFVGVFSTSQFISLFTIIIGIMIFNIDKIKLMFSKDSNRG